MPHILAIDPGLSGAICCLCNGTVSVVDMPVILVTKKTGKKRNLNITEFALILQNWLFAADAPVSGWTAIVEAQQAYPNQGAVSNYSTGYGYGMILGVLSALGIPFETVSPKTWQKAFGISHDTKGQSCLVAQRLFPQQELYTRKGKALDGRADALLLAEYARRRLAK